MGRKLQTIYEYFSDYSEKQIDDMMCKLSIYDKSLIISRFGKDLHIHHHRKIGVGKIA